MKKRERPSYAFLMEMMWVCAFFLICACIFVLAFAKAEQMSRKAETLNKATLAASNAMEEIYAAFDDAVNESGFDAVADGQTGFAAAAEDIGAAYSTDTFTLKVTSSTADGLLSVIVEATDTRDDEVLCTLNGARAAAISSAQHADTTGASTYAVPAGFRFRGQTAPVLYAAWNAIGVAAERRPL